MSSILIRLLMCVQVLFCPALCVDCCASHQGCSQQESVDVCDCCSHSGPTNPLEDGRPVAPCDPCSDSCNCFCGGAVVLQGDDLNVVVTVDWQFVVLTEFSPVIAKRITERSANVKGIDETRLYGRELLRTYCSLLI